MLTLEQKIEQFNEFYLIPFNIKVNVLPTDASCSEMTMAEFENSMPYAFKIAGEMAEIQSQTLKPLRGLGEKLTDLVDYLQFQAKKIDLMMSYILQQQDEAEHRLTAIKFGGGGVIVRHDVGAENMIEIGEKRIIKLFLESESAAIYCIAEAISSEPFSDTQLDVSYVYTHIREQDQELLVRASLHLQTQTLRKQHS